MYILRRPERTSPKPSIPKPPKNQLLTGWVRSAPVTGMIGPPAPPVSGMGRVGTGVAVLGTGVLVGGTLVLVGVGVAVSGNWQIKGPNVSSVNPCCSQYSVIVCTPSEVCVSRLSPTGATKPGWTGPPSRLHPSTENGSALLLITVHCIRSPGMDTQYGSSRRTYNVLGVMVGVLVSVGVAVSVGVLVAVAVAVLVAVLVGVLVAVAVAVLVGVFDAVAVAVLVAVFVAVGPGVLVDVEVRVGVAVGGALTR